MCFVSCKLSVNGEFSVISEIDLFEINNFEMIIAGGVLFDDTLLKVNEFTDGKVIFARPAGFTCEKQELTDPVFTLFKLECDEKGSITLCSDYETDFSVKNFNSYWINWQDKEASKYESVNVINEQRIINGHPYFYKVMKYMIEEREVFWRFIIMSDVETGKICLLSCYDEGYYSYIDEILNTIRFKQ